MISVVPHCGYLSETSRMLEIHRALRERGAPVRLATHGGTHQNLLGRAGLDYDLIEPRLTPARCAELVRSGPGLGPPDQSMWTDDELLAHAEAEATYFRDHDVSVVVTGFALTTLLSTRLAGVPLVTEHAGSFVPPLAERGLLPLPTGPSLPPPLRALPPEVARAAYNERFGTRDLYTAGFNRVAARFGVEPVPSLPALLLGDLTLVTDLPEVVGVTAEEMEAWRPAPGSPYRPSTRLAYAGPIHAHLDVPDAGPGGGAVALARHHGLRRDDLHRAGPGARGGRGRRGGRGLAGPRGRHVHDVVDLEALAPGRVVVEGVLPSHLVLPRVAAAVVTGGQGSVQAALSSAHAVRRDPPPRRSRTSTSTARRSLGRRSSGRPVGRRRGRCRRRSTPRGAVVRGRRHPVGQRFGEVDGPGVGRRTGSSRCTPRLGSGVLRRSPCATTARVDEGTPQR